MNSLSTTNNTISSFLAWWSQQGFIWNSDAGSSLVNLPHIFDVGKQGNTSDITNQANLPNKDEIQTSECVTEKLNTSFPKESYVHDVCPRSSVNDSSCKGTMVESTNGKHSSEFCIKHGTSEEGLLKCCRSEVQLGEGLSLSLCYLDYLYPQEGSSPIVTSSSEEEMLGNIQQTDLHVMKFIRECKKTLSKQPSSEISQLQYPKAVSKQPSEVSEQQYPKAVSKQPTEVSQQHYSKVVSKQPSEVSQQHCSKVVSKQPSEVSQQKYSKVVSKQPSEVSQQQYSKAVSKQPSEVSQLQYLQAVSKQPNEVSQLQYPKAVSKQPSEVCQQQYPKAMSKMPSEVSQQQYPKAVSKQPSEVSQLQYPKPEQRPVSKSPTEERVLKVSGSSLSNTSCVVELLHSQQTSQEALFKTPTTSHLQPDKSLVQCEHSKEMQKEKGIKRSLDTTPVELLNSHGKSPVKSLHKSLDTSPILSLWSYLNTPGKPVVRLITETRCSKLLIGSRDVESRIQPFKQSISPKNLIEIHPIQEESLNTSMENVIEMCPDKKNGLSNSKSNLTENCPPNKKLRMSHQREINRNSFPMKKENQRMSPWNMNKPGICQTNSRRNLIEIFPLDENKLSNLADMHTIKENERISP